MGRSRDHVLQRAHCIVKSNLSWAKPNVPHSLYLEWQTYLLHLTQLSCEEFWLWEQRSFKHPRFHEMNQMHKLSCLFKMLTACLDVFLHLPRVFAIFVENIWDAIQPSWYHHHHNNNNNTKKQIRASLVCLLWLTSLYMYLPVYVFCLFADFIWQQLNLNQARETTQAAMTKV